jgi:predicted lipoprotein
MKNSRRSLKVLILIITAISFLFILTACKPWTVVELDKENSTAVNSSVNLDGENTNLTEYVDELWTENIVPYIIKESEKNKAAEVISAIRTDQENAGEEYGIRESSAGTPWKYIISGEARIISLNTESRNGTADLDLQPYDDQPDLKMQIGPVIRGTSIRDSLDFISFDNFGNQIEYAQFSSQLNDKVTQEVLNEFNFENLLDKEINFKGVAVEDSSEIILTPVEIDLLGE